MPAFYYPFTGKTENLAMRFESLIAHAFEANHKYQDPLGFAAQDWYRNPIDDPKAVLLTAFGALAYRFKDTISNDQKATLRELVDTTKNAAEWPELASVVDRGLSLYEEL